jgi:hypothetical protein
VVPGPPFAFGAILVIMAFMVAIFIPENPHSSVFSKKKSSKLTESFNPGAGMFPLTFNTFVMVSTFLNCFTFN